MPAFFYRERGGNGDEEQMIFQINNPKFSRMVKTG